MAESNSTTTTDNNSPSKNDASTVVITFAWPITVGLICILLTLLLCMCRPELKGLVRRLTSLSMKRNADGSIELSFEAAKEEAQSALVKAEKVNRDLAAAKKASTATPVGGVKQQVAKVRATLPPRGERAEIRSVVKRIDHPLSGHVLWVDDHPENNEWERRAMELLGLTLTCKASTSEAMRLMIDQGMEFDVVISDMNRNHDGGATAGYGLARKLRANKYINPIIIYTYWDDKPALEQTGQADVETARQPAKLPAEHADEQAAGEPSPQDLAPMAIIRSATKLLEAVIRAVKYGV